MSIPAKKYSFIKWLNGLCFLFLNYRIDCKGSSRLILCIFGWIWLMRILSKAIIKASCIIFFTTSGAIPPLDLVNYQGDLQHCVTARMPTRYVKYLTPCGQQCLFFFQCSLQFYGYSKNLCGHQHQTKRQIGSLCKKSPSLQSKSINIHCDYH